MSEKAGFLEYLSDFITSEMNIFYAYDVHEAVEVCLREKVENLNSDVFDMIVQADLPER